MKGFLDSIEAIFVPFYSLAFLAAILSAPAIGLGPLLGVICSLFFVACAAKFVERKRRERVSRHDDRQQR